MEPAHIWNKVSNSLDRSYEVVQDPRTQGKSLLLIGGKTSQDYTSDVLKISFELSLKNLATDFVARNMCDHDPRMGPNLLPEELRSKIAAYKSVVGRKYMCKLRGCTGNLNAPKKD